MAMDSFYLKQLTAVVVCTLVTSLIFISIYRSTLWEVPAVNQIMNKLPRFRYSNSMTYQDILNENRIEKLTKQRNSLSTTLNKLLQTHGQLQCSISKGGLDSTGGWCKHESSQPGKSGSHHLTDMQLINYLAQFFKGQRVGSFGDGPGMYKKHLDATGLLEAYDAYDGAPFAPDVTDGRVKYLDLSVPQYGLPIYDWVMSLEVAEHIPKKYEAQFLSNIVRHARTGVILSWAVPGQGGFHHVNNQPLSYVIDIMRQMGFERNKTLSLFLQSKCTLVWLKRNTNVYFRQNDHPIIENDA